MGSKELTARVGELKELQALIEEAQERAEAIKDELKAEMTARGVDSLNAGAYKVRWQMVRGSRFDTAAFKRENAGLYDLYTIDTATRRFTVA